VTLASVSRSYSLYGLRLRADGEIPGLCQCDAGRPHDVRVWLNKTARELVPRPRICWYRSPELNSNGRPNLIIWRLTQDRFLHFVYDDGIQFLVSADGREIWCWWPPEVSAADAGVYLRGPISAMTLRLRGVVALHASTVRVYGRAVAFVGSCGAGKSTTAAAFAKVGYAVLTDDVAALNEMGGGFEVQPGYPWLNLWPDAAEVIFGSSDSLPRLTPADGINDWCDKRYLDLAASERFCRVPLPLAAVYVLGARSSDDHAVGIKALSPRDAFIELTSETCMNYALDESMRLREFTTLSRLANGVPVRLVTPHSNPARLVELCEDIVRDCLELSRSQLACAIG
jgi:hypothetical protein